MESWFFSNPKWWRRSRGRIETLHELRISRTSITDSGLSRLAGMNLRELDLNGVGVTDDCLDTILTLRDLERLDLTDTGITIEGMARLAGLPRLKRLDLYHFDTWKEIERVSESLPGVEIGDSLF